MIQYELVEGDALDVDCDVLLVKHAQGRYGIDKAVAELLVGHGLCRNSDISPADGDFALVGTRGHIGPKQVLVLGTPRLHRFKYDEMERFAREAASLPALAAARCHHLATTIHGAWYGLDPAESAQRLVNGFEAASTAGAVLERITIVEKDPRLAKLVREGMATRLGRPLPVRQAAGRATEGVVAVSHEPRGGQTGHKPHVFVAMPYGLPDSEDAYELAIFPVVRELGFVCEHVGKAAFAGDVLDRIRERISSARYVIADLTHSRPNVYLEVGFAWGCGVPVLFVAREGQELHFDVSTHKCVYYRNHTHLKRQLEDLLSGMDQ